MNKDRTLARISLGLICAEISALVLLLFMPVSFCYNESRVFQAVYTAAGYGLTALVFWLFVRKIETRPPCSKPVLDKTFMMQVAALAAAGAVVSILLALPQISRDLLQNIALGTLDAQRVLWLLSPPMSNAPTLLFIFVVNVVVVPLGHGFLMGKLLLGRLAVYGERAAILYCGWAAVLRSGGLADLRQLVWSILISIVLAYVTLKSGSWLYGALVHAGVNLYLYLFNNIGFGGDPVLALIIKVVVFAGILYVGLPEFIRQFKARDIALPPEEPEQPMTARTAICNTGGLILMILVCLSLAAKIIAQIIVWSRG